MKGKYNHTSGLHWININNQPDLAMAARAYFEQRIVFPQKKKEKKKSVFYF